MGCTSSTPSHATARSHLSKDATPVSHDSSSKKDTPPSVATDGELQQTRTASSAQNAASAISSTTSIPANGTSLTSTPTRVPSSVNTTPSSKAQPKFEASGSFKGDNRTPPAASDQPPMKRVAIVDKQNDVFGSQRSVMSRTEGSEGSGNESPQKSRRVDDYYDVDRTKRIGKGHYASVFIGKNKLTGQRVAVKMIEKRLSKTERLALEVNVMRKAGAHPNIVQLIDVFETENQLQLALELVEGGELFEHLVEHGPYSEATAAMHIRDVTRAIAFLHSQNIIHRDLKPENLLLTSKDDSAKVKVADFGLAKLMVADVTRTVCGTWAYCAYEVKKPGGAYDNKCDLWSIGVIAYILLSAYHPFDPQGDSTDDEIWEKISRADYNYNDPAWNNVSDNAKDFVSKLLVLDPKQRLSAEEALHHPWLKETAEQGAQEDKEHPQPALSPAINDKLANFQVRSKMAMNPLQKAAAAMKNRVGSWKSSSLSSTGSAAAASTKENGSSSNGGGSDKGSPGWTRRSMVIAAAAAAAAARTSRRSGGGSTPTNAAAAQHGEEKSGGSRTWSTSSGKSNHSPPSGSLSPAAAAAAAPASFFSAEANEKETPSSPHNTYVSSPLKTAALAAQPTEDTLLPAPMTPGAFPIHEDESENLSAQSDTEVDKDDILSSPVGSKTSSPPIRAAQTAEAVATVVVPAESSPLIANANPSDRARDDDEATMHSEDEDAAEENHSNEEDSDPQDDGDEEDLNETFVSAKSNAAVSSIADSDAEGTSFLSARSNADGTGNNSMKSGKSSS